MDDDKKWKLAPGGGPFVFVPGVVKPINCGSAERARLIAAAPALLAALEDALPLLSIHRSRQACDHVRAVIAAAKE